MQKRFISTCILIVYCTILIKIMVLKDVPTIRIGQLMLNFGGTDGGHPANFVPFKTILPYLLGYKGLIIAGINLVGNVALLVPIGCLVPLVYRHMTWKKALALAVIAGLAIEAMQVVLHVGIFDIDDVILNALGVMIGYSAFVILAKWVSARNYKNIIMTAVIAVAASAAFYGAVVYPISYQQVSPRMGAGYDQSDRSGGEESEIPESGDLCGGTGGNGQIVSVGNNTFTLERRDGKNLIVHITAQTTIRTSTGSASASDLKAEDRVTLVGNPNPDGSFTANTVVVCAGTGPETRSGQ